MGHDERLEAVLATWYEARDSQRPIEPYELIAAHPDLAEELRAHFQLMDVLRARGHEKPPSGEPSREP